MIRIYAIYSPISKNVYYIGASKNPQSRFNIHKYGAEWNPIHRRYKEAKALLKAKIEPELIILDEVDIKEAAYWEEFYVQLFKSWGFYLNQGTNFYPLHFTPSFRSKIGNGCGDIEVKSDIIINGMQLIEQMKNKTE